MSNQNAPAPPAAAAPTPVPPVPSRGTSGIRGKKHVPSSNRPKRTQELEFMPNTYAPVVEINSFRAPDSYHEFDHVADGFELLANDAANLLGNVAGQRFPGLFQPAVINETNVRMANLVLSKKLTYASTPLDQTLKYDDWKVVKNATIKVPSFAEVFGEGYGMFEHEGVRYRPRDVPVHCFSHYSRAVYDPAQDVGFNPLSLTINTASSAPNTELRSYLTNRIEAWIEGTPPIQVDINGTNYQTIFPSPRNISPLPPTIVADVLVLNPALVVPPDISAYFAIVSAIDANPLVIGAPAPAPIVALAAVANIQFVNWSSAVQARRLAYYLRTYEVPFSTVWASVYKVNNLSKMEDEGKPWQLADVSDTLMTRSQFSLSKTDLAIAHALDQAEHRVRLVRDQIRSTASTKTPPEMRIEVLRKGMTNTEYI